MYYLIYVSCAVKPMTKEDLDSLLKQSRDKNLKLSVTGILLYKAGCFMQMIEGEKETIVELYEVIGADERHKDVTTIYQVDCKERSFPNWSMGFVNMDLEPETSSYRQYFNKALNAANFASDTEIAKNLILAFNDNNIH